MPDPGALGATSGGDGVVAVVVTHHPAVPLTRSLLDALAPQVGAVVVVDNGSPDQVLAELDATAVGLGTVLALGTNRGIAAAQNVGIAWARDHDAQFVLLSDQDSRPAPDMVSRLRAGLALAAAEAAEGRRRPPAAVGPVATDDRNAGAALVFSDHRWGPRRATMPTDDGALVEATFLIASGCLIPMATLDAVGPMNEDWFIDHVDLEWGLRATRAGYGLYGVAGAGMSHSLGDRTQRIPGRERDVHIHSPVRNYYMARNTVLLIRSGLMSRWWQWGYAGWIAKYAVFYAVAVAPRGRRIGLLLRGLWHGLLGRTGPFPGGAR